MQLSHARVTHQQCGDCPIRHRAVCARCEEDEEGDEFVVEWRTLSDEEWAEATAAHERAVAEYKRTGGIYTRADGPQNVYGDFLLEDGSAARGIFSRPGSRWVWLSWGPNPEEVFR